MNTHSKLRTALLILATIPLATVACDDDIIRPGGIAEEPRMVIRPNRVTLEPGEIFKLDVVILQGQDEDHPDDIDLEWNSSDPDVAFPLGDGLIQAAQMGRVTVQADYRQWTATATVEVIHPRDAEIGPGG